VYTDASQLPGPLETSSLIRAPRWGRR
jgi:hypothetical protein